MLKKLDNILFHGLHLGIFLFWLYGATVYAPESPITPLLWFIAVILVAWGIFAFICKVNDRIFDKDIELYYSTNNPSIKRRIEHKYGRSYY